MGKVECFTIKLKKPDPVYRSGDALAGNVLIRVKERLKINSVKMAITGTARVHWYLLIISYKASFYFLV